MSEILINNNFGLTNKIIRSIWSVIYYSLFRFSPIPLFSYRNFILKLFGATIGNNVKIYPSVKIWLHSNLVIGENSCLGRNVHCYNQAKITIKKNVVISQFSYLCASSHDYSKSTFPLLLLPIVIEDSCWVCADAFVGPSVKLKTGTIIGARCCITKDTKSWSVYIGNPGKFLKSRRKISYSF